MILYKNSYFGGFMLGKCFAVICIISVVFACVTGNASSLAAAAISGTADAVTLVISLTGMMAFWSGILSVLKESGAIKLLSKLLSPILRIAFPNAWKTGIAKDEITASVAACIMGIGNASTPLALSAISKMQEANGDRDTATDDMKTLAVLGSCSFCLFPSTVVTMLVSSGSTHPFAVIVPVWICTSVCSAAAIILCRLAGRRK